MNDEGMADYYGIELELWLQEQKMRFPRAHKYHAKRCEMDGYKFASQAEMRRYQELKLMQAAGAIRNLVLQPRYQIEINGIRVCTVVADFDYEERQSGKWVLVTEDSKSGVRTPMYRLKAKMFAALYGREIRETS